MKVESITLDELRFCGLKVAQPLDGYRFSLDALLLADFVTNTGAPRRIADLGTGCGIIPMILCRRCDQTTAVGIDNNAEMAELARENVDRNGLTDKIDIISLDIIEAKKLFPVSSFDGVVANPPFRAAGSGNISPHSGRDTARHESTAGITEFMAQAKYLVKPSGRIWFVYLPGRMAEFIQSAGALNLSLLRIRMVHGRHDTPAKIFLAELAKGRKGETAVLPPLFIYEEDGEYTQEAWRILEAHNKKKAPLPAPFVRSDAK